MSEPDKRIGGDPVASDPDTFPAGDATIECPMPALSADAPQKWGHLQVLELLGRGGSSDVYRVWDEKLERQAALKLFRPVPDRPDPPSSSEARVLARLRHNNVVTVYGVDTLDGRLGVWMELIHGRTLEQIVRTDGTLSAAEACLTGIDLCRALSAVHAAGLLHRDIKPQNVVLEAGGRTVLMDFGLAEIPVMSGDPSPSGMCGTPAFMAPELLRGEPATVASDIYSLGVLLYFLVSGSVPVDADSFAQANEIHQTGRVKSLSDTRPDLPEEFLEVVDRATAADASARFATAAEMKKALAACLPVASADLAKSRRASFWRWLVAAVLVAGIVVSAFLLTFVRAGSERDAVLITELENQTSDQWLGAMAQDLLTTALGQSRRFYVVPRAGIAEGLALMRLPESTTVDAAVGGELGRREGIRIVLAGAITNNGGQYEVVMRAIDPVQKQTRAIARETFASRGELSTAMGRLAENLRRALGERGSEVAQSSRPLERVTTNSYDALVAYTTSMALYGKGRPDEAAPLMKRSIEIDPEFAMAHRQLATLFGSLGLFDEALQSATRAYELRDRATERERILIEALYHLRRADYEKSLDSYKLAAALYPEDPVAQYQMAQLYAFLRDVNTAVEAMRNAVRIAPRTELYRGLLAQLLIQANRPDEALHEIGEAQKIASARDATLSPRFLRRVEGTAWLAKGDLKRADEIFRSLMLDGAGESWARIYHAQSDMLQGRLMDAVLQLETAAGSHAGRDNRENELKGRAWAARIHLLTGNRGAALLHASVLESQVASPAHLRDIRNAGLIYVEAADEASTGRVAALLDDIAQRFPTPFSKAAAQQVRGELSRLQRRDSEAGAQLQEAWKQWPDTLTLWSLARYWSSHGDPVRAAALYERLLDDKGNVLLQEPMSLWVLAHYELASCASRLGDRRRAGQYASRFRGMWQYVDLPEVRRAVEMMQ
jgi:eukaryotic-like serine/threonine-protein kinase